MQHLALYKNVLALQFLLRTECKPCCIQLLVLRINGLGLLLTLRLQIRNIGIQITYRLVKLCNMDILCSKFRTKLLQLVVFLFELLDKIAHRALEFFTLE